jgi:CHAD domain-containing protein
MARIYPVKRKNPLRENMKNVLPVMYDDVMYFKETVLTHPFAKHMLHRMRIKGKPFRYAMEIGELIFGQEFAKCLEEVKNAVELMGEIHDADVMIPEMKKHLKEVRLLNSMLDNRKQHLSTKCIRDIIDDLRLKRNTMYDELCAKLNDWDAKNFREKLISSMNSLQIEAVTKTPAA